MITFSSKSWLSLLAIIIGAGSFTHMLWAAEGIRLAVPYVSQVPDGDWVLPWSQACEEASIVMIERFYKKQDKISKQANKTFMQQMIAWENKTFKKNDDTDAEQTKQIIEANASFAASVERNPSVDEIKDELRAKRPVIIFVHMYQLYQDKTTAPIDPFHVAVVTGFDDNKGTFLVHDPAKEANTAYSYDVVMKALHDFNNETKQADKEATVLFTDEPKESGALVKFVQWMGSLFSGLFS